VTAEPESFGERLGRLRRAKGWKQAALAARIGVSVQQVSKYERGVYEPKLAVLVCMAQVLGRSIDYLLTGQEPSSEPDPLRALWPVLVRLPPGLRSEVADFLKTVVRAGYLLDPEIP
jgi:transcriptional regulator with XRE-family HTH domain